MNLYLIEQSINNHYDTFDSAVVQAKSTEEARNIHPAGCSDFLPDEYKYSDWAKPEDVKVTFLGTATPSLNQPVVICSSFNAG